MTQTIHRDTRRRALEAADIDNPARTRLLLRGVQVFTALTTLAGTILTVADLASGGEVHLVMAAVACFVLAGIAAAVLCIEALLADRQEFYRRGQLDGYHKGWHGQIPDVDDPLLRLRQ